MKVFRTIHANVGLPNERELLLAAQQGDASAFKELYEHYCDRIYNVIRYSLKDAAAAEDALQNVFIKVYEALPCFRLESSFLTWVYRVAINECKNRKRSRWFFTSLEEISDNLNHAHPAPDALHAADELKESVRLAVLQLRPKYRQVVALKYSEDLSYEEIAAILKCSPGTVASRLHRALDLLEKRLRKER